MEVKYSFLFLSNMQLLFLSVYTYISFLSLSVYVMTVPESEF